MPSPTDLPAPTCSMSPQLPLSARLAARFFSRALSLFQSSDSKLRVICTVPPSAPQEGEPAILPPRDRPRILVVLDSSFNPPTRAHLHMATSAIQELTHKQGQQQQGDIRLLLLLSVNNADKGVKPAAFDKRLAMMWAFARDVQNSLQTGSRKGHVRSGVEALSVDLGLARVPYFHEKSAALAEDTFYKGERGANSSAEMEQVFLVGYDTLIRIFNPKYYGPPEPGGQVLAAESSPLRKALDPLFSRARLRVTMRTDDEWGGAEEQVTYLEHLLRAEGLDKASGVENWGSKIEMVEGHKTGNNVISSTYARAAAKDQDMERLDLQVSPEVRWWIEQENLYSE